MIPDKVRRTIIVALARLEDTYRIKQAEVDDKVLSAGWDKKVGEVCNAQRWLDKPYSHRNGETEPPEVQGHYWFRGLNTRTDHRVRKWVMGRIDRNMVFVYAYGWGRPEEFIGEWHGPVPEPETQHE